MQTVRAYYGTDPTEAGFYWVGSAQKRQEALSTRRNAPMQFEAVYQCRPGARSGSVFLASDIAYYDPPLDWESFRARGDFVAQSWDTGGSARTTADYSVGLTANFVPCNHYHCGEDPGLLGPCEPHFDVYIMNVFRDRKDFGDLLPTVRAEAQIWRPSVVLIEDKSSGAQLLQTLPDLPVEAVKPGNLSKRARAVTSNGAASVQGWMRMHRVYFPEGLEFTEPLRRELLNFTGAEGDTDDQVDALVYLILYAISQGGGGAKLPTDSEKQMEQAAQQSRAEDAFRARGLANAGILEALMTGQSFDPFQTSCGRCTSFDQGPQRCLRHDRKTFALNTCGEFNPSDGGLMIL